MKSLLFAAALAPLTLASARADFLLSPADTKWFHDQANTIVQEARIAPGETAGTGERPGDKNTTPYVLYVPDGPRAYGAFFPRDSNMDLAADFISEKDVEGYIRLMAATVLQTPWQVRPGIKVPAWTLPDHVYLNGKANYWPGPQTGNDMGGGSFQSQPPLDDSYFFLFTVAEQARMTGNVDFLRQKVAIAGGEISLADLCMKVFDASPVNPVTGLVQTGDIDTPDCAHDFGFCDGVAKSGKLLFHLRPALRRGGTTRAALPQDRPQRCVRPPASRRGEDQKESWPDVLSRHVPSRRRLAPFRDELPRTSRTSGAAPTRWKSARWTGRPATKSRARSCAVTKTTRW